MGHVNSTPEATVLAVVLACGPDAVLSHGSAAALWGIYEPGDAAIHVMAPNRRGRSPAGIVSHRDGCLSSSDRTDLHRVPCTTVSRTLLKPDFLWREQRLILEADSRQFHDTDTAFVDDRRREQRLQVAGWRVSHCTWEQVEFEPQALAETIRQLLSQG